MKVLFVLNRIKRGTTAIPERMWSIARKEHVYKYLFTDYPSHASKIAFENASDYDMIVPVGGDGTTSECVDGIMRFREGFPEKPLPVIAPWPFGSGNDFARNFGWKNNTLDFLKRLRDYKTEVVDVGLIQLPEGEKKYFINECSIGLGPAVVKMVEYFPSKWSGQLKFNLAILLTFPFYRKKTVQLKSDTVNWKGKFLAIVAANGKYFGSGIGIAPNANTADGHLNLTIIGNVSMYEYLRQLPTLKKCRIVKHEQVMYHEVKQLSFAEEVKVERDGEYLGSQNIEIKIIPAALKLLR